MKKAFRGQSESLFEPLARRKPQQALPPLSYSPFLPSGKCEKEHIMQWTVVADILRALAAGITAVIAALKFIYDIRQKQQPTEDEPEIDEEPMP